MMRWMSMVWPISAAGWLSMAEESLPIHHVPAGLNRAAAGHEYVRLLFPLGQPRDHGHFTPESLNRLRRISHDHLAGPDRTHDPGLGGDLGSGPDSDMVGQAPLPADHDPVTDPA